MRAASPALATLLRDDFVQAGQVASHYQPDASHN